MMKEGAFHKVGPVAGGRYRRIVLPLLAAALIAGCASRDERANAASVEAETMAQLGDLRGALIKAHEATTLADDVSAYWLQLARLQMAARQTTGAFDSYQKALEADPYNVEALTTLCGIALNTGRPDDLDRYADRLLALSPTDRNARNFKAGAALLRGDEATANGYLDKLLAEDGQDLTAMLLKARLLSRSPRTSGEAATMIEASLQQRSDEPLDRLRFLRTLYLQRVDRTAYRRTVQRIAAAVPADPDAQIAYAVLLYDEGSLAEARDTVIALAKSAPDRPESASAILETWRDRGPDAMPVDQLIPAARTLSPRLKAIFARWANDRRRPDIALSMLGPAAQNESPDAVVARAEANFLSGGADRPAMTVERVLQADPRLPAALALRAEMALAAQRPRAAIADARTIVSDDPQNVTARLLLADALRAGGEGELAMSTLREGIRAVPGSVRLAQRLADWLRASDQIDDAADVFSELTANAPISLAAWDARRKFCAAVKNSACVELASRTLAQLRRNGGDAALVSRS